MCCIIHPWHLLLSQRQCFMCMLEQKQFWCGTELELETGTARTSKLYRNWTQKRNCPNICSKLELMEPADFTGIESRTGTAQKFARYHNCQNQQTLQELTRESEPLKNLLEIRTAGTSRFYRIWTQNWNCPKICKFLALAGIYTGAMVMSRPRTPKHSPAKYLCSLRLHENHLRAWTPILSCSGRIYLI